MQEAKKQKPSSEVGKFSKATGNTLAGEHSCVDLIEKPALVTATIGEGFAGGLTQQEQDKILATQAAEQDQQKLTELPEDVDELGEELEGSQERVQLSEEELIDSQDSFETKVDNILGNKGKISDVKEKAKENQKELEKMDKKLMPTRKCERLKGQEDADRTKLAMQRAEQKNSIPGATNGMFPTASTTPNSVLIDIASKVGVNMGSDSVTDDHVIDIIKSLEIARETIFKEGKIDKSISDSVPDNQFQLISEEINELLSDSDSEHETLYQKDSRPKRSCAKNNKIMKLCSPVFRVEPARKRGRPPKNKIS